MKVATSKIIQELDRETINRIGIPGIVLMENAGRGAISSMFNFFGDLSGKKVAIFSGRGNNGGDGLVIGRVLHNKGIKVKVYLLSKFEKLQGDARKNFEIYRNCNGSFIEVPEVETFRKYSTEISNFDIIIDAIFGTGLKGEVEGFYREVIEFINSAGKPVVSVDIPSGLNSDTGRPLGICVRASLTVTFGLPKIGHLIYPGAEYCASIKVIDIGIPNNLIQEKSIPYNLITAESLKGILRKRPPDSHKGHFGHILVIAGSVGKTGAAAMTCDAAMRVGAGLVTLGIPSSLNPIMESKLTEVMTFPLRETEEKSLHESSLEDILDLSKGKSLLCIGPGLSTNPSTQRLIIKLIKSISLPMIVDADGINAISEHLEVLSEIKGPIVLTPHPGEMARLMRCTVKEIQEDRIGKSMEFARHYGVYLILKGARSIIACPDGEVYINPTGNAAMATAGMGDILTGIIAGLACQGISLRDALIFGVYLHGYVGDIFAKECGDRGLVATDLLNWIPRAIHELNTGEKMKDGFSHHRK